MKTYEYDAVIQASEVGKVDRPLRGGAFVAFPYDVRAEFGKGRVKVHALFYGEPYDGSVVTDFHSCDYGKGQRELTVAIDAEKPDAVLFVGDNFDDRNPPGNAEQLMRNLVGKYTCFYVAGNHDTEDEYKRLAESIGVTVLAGTSVDFMGITVAGIDDPDVERYAKMGNITTAAAPYAEQLTELRNMMNPEKFTILLSHRPERIDEFLTLNPDLVVSGHAHGGQWRVPYILENGLIAPNQGFFPKYTNGAYSFGGTTLIVSRGLARESTRVPRMFNRPELVIVAVGGGE